MRNKSRSAVVHLSPISLVAVEETSFALGRQSAEQWPMLSIPEQNVLGV
jgi:hypothetical protein